jgi:hypothetical protein
MPWVACLSPLGKLGRLDPRRLSVLGHKLVPEPGTVRQLIVRGTSTDEDRPVLIEPNGTPIPDVLVIDSASGYAVNVPVTEQNYPFWWNDRPEVYARILQTRTELGIEVVDFPDGVTKFPTEKVEMLPMRRPGE